MPEGEAMIVTLKRVGGVWVLGRLDGTTQAFATALDGLFGAIADIEALAREILPPEGEAC